MTVSSTLRRAGPFATNGAQTEFPFAFKVFSEEDVTVTVSDDGVETTYTYGDDYDVALNADQDSAPGGTVTLGPVLNGPKVTITSDMDPTQPAVFTNQGGFYPRVLNDSLDRVVIMTQQVVEKLGRALLAPFDTAPVVGRFPVVLGDGTYGFSNGTGADAGLRDDLADSTLGASLVAVGQTNLADAVVTDVRRYGADDTGTSLADTAILAAIADGKRTLRFPAGRYRIKSLPILQYAGIKLFGDSRFDTVFEIDPTATGSVIRHPTAGSPTFATSYGPSISDIFFDFGGVDVVAIDLSGVNNASIRRVRGVGGTSIGTAVGTLVRCAAPGDVGSYNNKIVDCDATYMARAFVAEDAANENTFDNCEALVSVVGFDVENGVDTARVIGGRAEGCTTGLRTGGRETVVLGCRFEANTAADVEFEVGAERPTFIGCYTASSPVTFLDEANCTGLFSRGGTFPRRDIEPNLSNPALNASRVTFAAAGSTPEPSSASTDYSVVFQDYVLIGRAAGIEFENGTAPDADNRVLFANIDSNNRVSIPGFDRKAGAYTPIFVGSDWNFNPGVGLEWAGVKVLGSRVAGDPGAASDPATTQALANWLRTVVNTHGLGGT